MSSPVRAVLVDLDDTLYPQSDFLTLAWSAVADRGAALGLDRERLLGELTGTAALGSARGGIIDTAVERVGGDPALVGELVAAFHDIRPARLTPYAGVPEALAALRSRVPVVVITDGAPAGQRAKLDALGLAVDAVVLSDLWGRSYRKPHPRPFRAALALAGVDAPADAVMIGDRPDKDVAGAAALGIRTVRVRTGEYRDRADHDGTWRRAATFAEAVRLLEGHLPDQSPAAPPGVALRAATLP